MDYNINFPNLHIYLENVGKTIMIGDFAIAYYGIVIACGMIGGVLIAATIAKRSGQDPEDYFDMALYAIIFAVLGARMYFVIFNWDYYAADLTRIFNIREGGLGIYGGIIASIITVYILTRRKKLDFGLVADTAAPALIFGQCLGRWGNFFNREAFGGYTDNLFAMQLPVSAVRRNEITAELWEHAEIIDGITYIQVHPTFLYESMWNFVLMISLLFYWKHRKFNGEVFLLYLLGYGVGRFWIESLRTDQLILPILEVPVSMVVAALMVVGSAIWIILGRRKSRMAEDK
ncbi:MAG: prolipoprotein diacylglyceryl transferase [Agathobacter sp.]|nr:prolipoprotein diacylglyceryl transferase [Agathobacter sp.]